MKRIFYSINGIAYFPNLYGNYNQIQPFAIVVPVQNLNWLKSLKFSHCMKITNEYYTGNFAKSKIVIIRGFADHVYNFLTSINCNFSEYQKLRVMWCPNIWRILRNNDKHFNNDNPFCYEVYYKDKNGKLQTTFVSNYKLPKNWRNAQKIFRIKKMF